MATEKVQWATKRLHARRLVTSIKQGGNMSSMTLAELLDMPSLDARLCPLQAKPLPDGYVVGSQGLYRVSSSLHRRIARTSEERPDNQTVTRNCSEKQRQDTIERRLQSAQEIASEKFRRERAVAASKWSVAGRDQASRLAVSGAPRTPDKVVRDELSRSPLPHSFSPSRAQLDSDGRIVSSGSPSSMRRRKRASPGRWSPSSFDRTVTMDVGAAVAGSICPDRLGRRTSPTQLAPLHNSIDVPPRWWGQSASPSSPGPIQGLLLSPPGAPHISAHNSGMLQSIVDDRKNW